MRNLLKKKIKKEKNIIFHKEENESKPAENYSSLEDISQVSFQEETSRDPLGCRSDFPIFLKSSNSSNSTEGLSRPINISLYTLETRPDLCRY